VLQKIQGSIQDNKADHSFLDNAGYHEQYHAVCSHQDQGVESPGKVTSANVSKKYR
jgi:hypothetical protein